MTRRPARQRRPTPGLRGVLALSTLLLGGLLPGALLLGAAPAAATPAAASGVAAQTTAPLTVSVSDLRPRAPQPGDDLQVLGTLANSSSEQLHELQLRVRVGSRLASRGELRQADLVPPTYRERDVEPLPDLPAGGQTPLDLRVPVDDLRLGADGVYPLQVEVRGLRGRSTSRQQLGVVSTYLPWFGTTTVDPLRIAWLWPVVDQPRRGPREIMLDDVLATSLAPGGRLGRSLTAARSGETGTCPPTADPVPVTQAPAGPAPATPPPTAPEPAPTCRPVPVTYAVDPDLLFNVQAMTKPYDVRTPGGTRPGEGTAAATAWLASMQAGVAAGDVIALPFADPDVVALSRGSSGLAADVALARTYGVTVTRDVLGEDVLQTVSFPPPGRLSDAAFDAVTTGSTRAVVLGDDAVSAVSPGARSTPGARVSLPPSSTSGPVAGLVVDRGLSDLLVPDRPQDARLAEQRWLVETAMVAAELPSRGRTLLVAPPRRGDLDPAVVGAALADTGGVPWMCAVRLRDVAAAQERCPTADAPSYTPDRSAELAQPDPRAPTLSAELLSRVSEVREAATQLTGSVIKGGTEQAQNTRARMQRAWLRGESTAWRDDPAAGVRLVELAAADVADLRGKVSVLTGRVTLTSNNGRVSVAVVNELDQPVTVAVRLRAPSDARLSKAQTDVLEVPARTSLPVQVDAQTLTSGRFIVKAQLLDRDGVPFGEPKDLLVRSTRYGTVALAVTGLGAAVLFIAAGVRVVRRALRRPTPA